MNWLDGVILALAVVFAVIGWRMGALRGLFLIVGLFVATVAAGQVSSPLGGALTDSLKSEALASVVAYGVVFTLIVAAAMVAAAVVGRFIRFLFLGPLDTLLGGALGALTGFLMGGALIAVLARYAFLLPPTDLERVGAILGEIDVRQNLREALVDSNLVAGYLESRDFLPARTLGMIPGDYNLAFEAVKESRAAHEAGVE